MYSSLTEHSWLCTGELNLFYCMDNPISMEEEQTGTNIDETSPRSIMSLSVGSERESIHSI